MKLPGQVGIVLALSVLALAPPAGAKVGALKQLRGKAGCLAQQDARKPVRKDCTVARFGGIQMWRETVSPDGRNLYVASIGGAVSVLRIDKRGHLHQAPGKAGCLSRTGRSGCTVVPQLNLSRAIALSPDGRTVYVGSTAFRTGFGGVVVFGRNRRTGALHKIQCIGENGAAGCIAVPALFGQVSSIAVSRDGQRVYVGWNSADPGAAKFGAIATFSRAPGGRLTQRGCVNGDGSLGCTQARALLPDCCGLVVSPNSRFVYATSSHRIVQPGTFEGESASFAIASFSNGPSGLSQLAGTAGCVNRDGSDGCGTAAFAGTEPVNEAADILMSPNGRDVYVAHSSAAPDFETNACAGTDNFIAAFARDPATGALGTLRQDIRSCGVGPAMSPDGRSLYATAGNFGNAMSLFSRNPRNGVLAPAGCIGFEVTGCRTARHVPAPSAIAVTPNGRFAYVVSDDFNQGETIGVFRRSLR
jgi:6-phosphogluconolactonase (cycloisomerase 2 family)